MGGRRPFILDQAHYGMRDRHNTFRAFAKWLLDGFYAAGTVDNYLSDVIDLHREWEQFDVVGQLPSYRRWLRQLRVAACRKRLRRHAFTKDMLVEAHRLYRTGVVDYAEFGAVVVAWFLALRRKEFLAASTRKVRALQLSWRRVRFCSSAGKRISRLSRARARRVAFMQVRIYRKNDGGRGGHWMPVYRSGHPAICPFLVLLRLALETGAPADQPIFSTLDGRFVEPRGTTRLVKRCARACGKFPMFYSIHSLRRGGSHYIAAARISDEMRKEFCAWHSATHQIYKDPLPELYADFATRMWGADYANAGTRA